MGKALGGSNSPATPVNTGLKIIYGVGQVANVTKIILFGMFSLFFYTTVMGLSGTLVGIATAIGLLWDAIIDPVIGTLSDATRNRWLGKRHGYMLFGAVGMGVAFWIFFSPPQSLGTTGLFCWVLTANLLVRTMSSVFSIPYYALGAELSQDYHERTSISAYRAAAALIGTMAVAGLTFILFFPMPPDGGDPKLDAANYRAMGLVYGVMMSVVGLASTVGTLSCRQFNPERPSDRRMPSLGHIFENSCLALKNPSFRMLFFSYSFFFLGTVINGTLAIHFLTYYAEIVDSKALSTFQFVFYTCATAGIFCWLKVSKTFEKRPLYLAGMVATALIMGSSFIFLGKGRPLGTGSIEPLLIGGGIAGFFASVLWVIPASMIADIADQDQL